MENLGTNGELFDLNPWVGQEKQRKPYETEAEKLQKQAREIRERDILNIQRKANTGKPLTADESRRLNDYLQELGQETGDSLPAGVVRTQREVAEHFGKHVQTIKNWCADGMPRNPDSYDLAAIEIWAIEKELIRPAEPDESQEPIAVDGSPDPDNNSKAYYELQVKKQQAEKLKIENEVRRGELVPVDDVEAGRVARIMTVKRVMMSTPRTWAPRFVMIESAREAEAILTELMTGICARFSEG